jgi:hypothetical protein
VVSSRESYSGLPYSKPTHYQLSNAALQLSNAAPQLSNAAPQLSNASPKLSNAAPQLRNAAPQLSNAEMFNCTVLREKAEEEEKCRR